MHGHLASVSGHPDGRAEVGPELADRPDFLLWADTIRRGPNVMRQLRASPRSM
jgi:hypothetical protein